MYKTVKINDLSPVKNTVYKSTVNPDTYWPSSLNGYSYDNKPPQYKLQYAKANGTADTPSSNPFLTSFMHAYNNHEDIILSPDDVWTVITLNFTKYVNENAEELRKIFVDHDGKKKLTVKEPIGKDENDWTDFFSEMKKQIGKNVKGDIVNTLQSDFTTTGEVESIVSYACIMDTFKQYFSYGRCIPCCGIRNVKFMGNVDDWKNLRKKAENISNFLNGNADKSILTNISNMLTGNNKVSQFTKYIDDLLPILDKFVDTYNENVDVQFWNKIMDITHGRIGSGSTTYISGWILNFFLGYGGTKAEAYDIKLNTIKVTVELTNHNTGLQKECVVVGGFIGTEYKDNSIRPVMSIAVLEDTTTVKQISTMQTN
jgi:hypothetical protein